MKAIVVPVDFSDGTARVLDEAAVMAKALEAEVWLLHVAAPEPDFVGYEPGPQSVRDAVAKGLSARHQQLQAYEHELAARGVGAHAVMTQGYAVDQIVAQVRQRQASLVVMGSHGHGALYHMLMGSVTEGVLRQAPCPLLVVPIRAGEGAAA
jgi:nucleotide-binding universal stress UspA family protein